jgi:hypothetical protein
LTIFWRREEFIVVLERFSKKEEFGGIFGDEI